jgi:hypothetical protein
MGEAAHDFVSTTLNYYTPPADGTAPWSIADADPTTGQRKQNWERKPFATQIENMRGREDTVSLDTAGFEFHAAPTAVTDFTDDEAVKQAYYPESEAILKKLTGAKRVVLFDHTIRRNRPGEIDDSPQKRQPVPLVHVDQTPASAETRVKRHAPEDAEELLKSRYQIVNLWRPISHPATDFPLALCDFRSIDTENDLVPLRLEFSTYTGQTYAVQHNTGHRWKYLRSMRPDELVLIKCFDSDTGVARLTPHTAFVDPTTPEGTPYRESIELRALLFY